MHSLCMNLAQTTFANLLHFILCLQVLILSKFVSKLTDSITFPASLPAGIRFAIDIFH